MVRKGGLEPPRLSAPDPKSGASANSATFALPKNSASLLNILNAAGGIEAEKKSSSNSLVDRMGLKR